MSFHATKIKHHAQACKISISREYKHQNNIRIRNSLNQIKIANTLVLVHIVFMEQAIKMENTCDTGLREIKRYCQGRNCYGVGKGRERTAMWCGQAGRGEDGSRGVGKREQREQRICGKGGGGGGRNRQIDLLGAE